jgi:hypothetical protein
MSNIAEKTSGAEVKIPIAWLVVTCIIKPIFSNKHQVTSSININGYTMKTVTFPDNTVMTYRIEFKISSTLTVQTESQDLKTVPSYVIYDCPLTKNILTPNFIVMRSEATSIIDNRKHQSL